MKVISVVGARPNFMKIAPFIRAVRRYNACCNGRPAIDHLLVHTGQHYDDRMSRAFFKELEIPEADVNLGVGSGSHAEQIGQTMIAFEKVVRDHKPDWIVVVGDVNATCACAITAKKEQVRLAHVEAGLRSHDMSMPEEINRLVTDRLSDLLFTPDRLSGDNLRTEGTPKGRIRFVGNIMIDTLERERAKAERIGLQDLVQRNLLASSPDAAEGHLGRGEVVAVTLHRPSNVDVPAVLAGLVDFLIDEASREMSVIWPVHPRTLKQLEAFGLWSRVRSCRRLVLLHPIGYHEMLCLSMNARVVLTDSGGLQEECCVLGTPCLTLRQNTERPVTLHEHGGASVLVGNDVARIREQFLSALTKHRKPFRPDLWDGRTAERIVAELVTGAAG